jgi:hypothetical protein
MKPNGSSQNVAKYGGGYCELLGLVKDLIAQFDDLAVNCTHV